MSSIHQFCDLESRAPATPTYKTFSQVSSEHRYVYDTQTSEYSRQH